MPRETYCKPMIPAFSWYISAKIGGMVVKTTANAQARQYMQ